MTYLETFNNWFSSEKALAGLINKTFTETCKNTNECKVKIGADEEGLRSYIIETLKINSEDTIKIPKNFANINVTEFWYPKNDQD